MGDIIGLRRFEVMNLSASHIDTEAWRLVSFKRKAGLHDDMAYGSAVALIAQRLAYTARGPGSGRCSRQRLP